MERNITEQLKDVESLIQLDIDAIHAYDQAISRMSPGEVRAQLVEFRKDHERHVKELSQVCRNHGGTPPEFEKDFKGFLIEGLTLIRSSMGDEQAVKAMRDNEKLTNRNYEKRFAASFHPDIQAVIERGLKDERRHLAYIEKVIELRSWETKAKDKTKDFDGRPRV